MIIACRAATPDDEPFLRSVIYRWVSEELGAANWPASLRDSILDTQYRAREASQRAAFPHASNEIIEVDGVPCGWIASAVLPSELRLIDVAMLPEHRRKGIGSEVIREVLDRAAARNLPVTLHVHANNRDAIRLYSNLGFEPVSEDQTHVFMRR